jgi:DNA mismatch repair protein MSH5
VEIIHQLRVKILAYTPTLTETSRILGELDWYPSAVQLTSLLSLTYAAEEYRFSRPYITTDNVINIVGGRHPLQERVVPQFVENDTCLVGGENDNPDTTASGPSVILLTGANYSGKSVYLKQVSS